MNIQKLPAEHGWRWIKQGYSLFMKAPVLWVAMLIICCVAAVLVSAIPLIGDALVSVCTPIVLIGLMSAARAVQQGEALELAYLFSGLQKRTAHLLMLGGIALLAQYLIFGGMWLVGGEALVKLLISQTPLDDTNSMTQAMVGAGFAAMLGVVLFSIVMMAMQFAPMLVYANGIAPLEALKISLRAFLKNIPAMLVYSLTLTSFAILASLPLMLGWLVLLPIVFISLYASYCDIFPVVTATPPTNDTNVLDDPSVL
jgi:uncharacterized membrane protein